MNDAMLFPFIDDAMKLIAFALLVAVPMMMMTRPSSPQAMARLQRRRERKLRCSGASTATA
ncbi:MAG: hypothetical protein M3O62_10655 [Pseudomonadota bacterium]|nr:hypothetical protein [Pseudomonadota bacterium]